MKKYYAGICLLFCFLLVFGSITEGKNGSIIVSFVGEGVDGGWLSGWQYRRSHEIQGSPFGAVVDYQVKVTVYYGSGSSSGDVVYLNGHCREDFGDIRFTSEDGETLLSYWIEEKVNSDHAVFWVKVPSIPASPDTTTIYIYYGNPTATTASDGEATFLLFDNFDFFDTSKWTKPKVSVYAGYTIENSNLVIYIGTRGKSTLFNGGTNAKSIDAFEIVNKAFVGRFKCRKKAEGDKYATHNIGIGYYSTGDSRCWGRNDRRTHALTSKTGLIYGTASGTWDGSMTPYEKRELRITSSKIKCFCDGNLIFTQTGLSLSGQRNFYISLAVGDGYSADAWAEIYVDWVFIRKYVDPEPSHGTWGAEKEYGVLEVVTHPAQVSGNEVLLTGEITNTGEAQVDMRGFEWGTEPGVYTEEWIESGSFNVGTFTYTLTLPTGVYYYHAKAHNSYGWSYGEEEFFVVAPWLSGWRYRKAHKIDPALGAGIDYQLRFILHYGVGVDNKGEVYLNSHSRTDFGDVRFTSSDGQSLLNYWIEEKVDGDYAIVWVKINANLTSSPTVIFIYYGKLEATSASNGDATFIFFDDFSTKDTSKWAYPTDWTVENGYLKQTYSGSWPPSGSIWSIASFSQSITSSVGVSIETYAKNLGTTFAYDMTTRWDDDTDHTVDSIVNVAVGSYDRWKAWGTLPPTTDFGEPNEREWHRYQVILFNGDWRFLMDGTQYSSYSASITAIVAVGVNSKGQSYYDFMFIRKYVDPEPAHGAWGAEEERTTNQPPNAPILDSPIANVRFDPLASVTFSWTFSDPDSGDSQSAYQFQLDDNSDFSSPIIDTGKVTSSTTSTTQTLPSTVEFYYWRVKTWDSQDAEGAWSEARPIIVDRINIIAGGIVDFTIDVDMGGKVWYYAVYEYDNSTFDGSCGVLYVNGFEMTWNGEKWIYAFPYSTEGNQITFHITGMLDSQYGLTEINNQAGDITINWATATIEIER